MRMERNETRVSITRLRLSRSIPKAISPSTVTFPLTTRSTPGTHWISETSLGSKPPPSIPPWRPVTRSSRETTNETTKAPTTTWPPPIGRRFPKRPTTRNARRGAARMTQAYSNTLPPQEADAVQLHGAARLEERQEDGEADGGLRGGDGNPQEREELPVRVVGVGGEGDEIHHRRVDHDLDGHQDDDRVPSSDNPPESDDEEQGGERQLIGRGDHGASSLAR